jgi:RNA polymerase sigma factor (TIGR02999 family)
MTRSDEGDAGGLTALLARVAAGDAGALQTLFETTYADLRTVARARLRPHRSGTPLDTCALVHETFMRLANTRGLRVEQRAQFFCYASRVMRSVIVDTLREQRAQRRGGDHAHEALPTQLPAFHDGSDREVLRVHEALDGLAQYDQRLVDVVQMRYFAGMTEQEIALALNINERTVRRDWEKARLLLLEALAESQQGAS